LTETRLKHERGFSSAETYLKLDEEVSGRFPQGFQFAETAFIVQ